VDNCADFANILTIFPLVKSSVDTTCKGDKPQLSKDKVPHRKEDANPATFRRKIKMISITYNSSIKSNCTSNKRTAKPTPLGTPNTLSTSFLPIAKAMVLTFMYTSNLAKVPGETMQGELESHP
jgi:hypothetical protein